MSIQVSRKYPAISPKNNPSVKPIIAAAMASVTVLPTARITSDSTGRPVAMELPRSPPTARHSQSPNCTGSGRSKPYAIRNCAASSCDASAGSTATSGSPGVMWTSRKHTSATLMTIGIT